VLGVEIEDAVGRFRTQMPARFRTAEEDVWVQAVVFEVGEDGRATSMQQVLEPVDHSGP
jgi:calcineurin-like phosphoesterase